MNTRATQTAGTQAPPKVPKRDAGPILAGQPGPSAQESAAIATSPAMLDSSLGGTTPAFIEPERRRAMIAEAAYFLAERRGFEPGYQLEDWCAAESEIDAKLTGCGIPAVCGVGDLI